MTIPQNQYLRNQSFRSNLVEFVWEFKHPAEEFVLQIKESAEIYMESIPTNIMANPDDFKNSFELNCNGKTLESTILNPALWKEKTLPIAYNYFSNGKDLIPLITEILEFLKN